MIFLNKPYYNPNYTNFNKKKSLSDLCPKPKKLYKVNKFYNAKPKKLKKTQEKNLKTQILKLLSYKNLLIEKKP